MRVLGLRKKRKVFRHGRSGKHLVKPEPDPEEACQGLLYSILTELPGALDRFRV